MKRKKRTSPSGATKMTALAAKADGHPSENAMFAVPVASVNEATGITQRLPDNIIAERSVEALYPAPVSGKIPMKNDGLPDSKKK